MEQDTKRKPNILVRMASVAGFPIMLGAAYFVATNHVFPGVYQTEISAHNGVTIVDSDIVVKASKDEPVMYNIKTQILTHSEMIASPTDAWKKQALEAACSHPGAAKIDADDRTDSYPEIAQQVKDKVAAFQNKYC
jgi:hypothetical protein